MKMKTTTVKFAHVLAGVLFLAASAGAGEWFDAGISGLSSWPVDGSDKIVEGQGTWMGTTNATLVNSLLKVDTETAGASLAFDPAVHKTPDSAQLTFSTVVTFSVADDFPEIEDGARCGVSVFIDENDVTNYCGIVKNPTGEGDVWVALTGAVPKCDEEVELVISIKKDQGRSYARYSVDGAVLAAGSETWLEIRGTSEMAGRVAYTGVGDVASLSATADTDVPVVFKTLTLPELAHVTVTSVKVAGVDVEPDGEGRYVVEQGSAVTVAFAPEAGWALDVASMTFVVNDDMTLPMTGRPTPVNVAATITINEVMAKNGVTVRTKTGFEGLDWVELYNSGDEAIDLSGWYMGNDPTKAPNKWKQIEGSCVVPAKGYKIVWFDGDKLCKNWAPDEAHVEANISTDAGKHTVFLASANASADNIVQQIKLPGGVKDISYGRGRLSRTLVSSTSPAEYKVGSGAWTAVDGPVGMSAAAGGFTVVSYKINKDVGNMDVVDACLLDPSTWVAGYPVTNTTATLAFVGPNTTASFDQSLYGSFPGGVSGNNFICVATATVQIPESGDWTFDVGSDDGFSAKLTRLDRSWGWESRGSRGYGHSTATFNLEAGAYEVEVRYFNAGGGYVIDFSAVKGRTGFNAETFQLVGMGSVVHAGALGAQVAADVSGVMVGQSKTLEWRTKFTLDETPVAADGFRLRVKYADGFSARVNGTPVASVAASAARPAADALRAQEFVVDPALVVKGTNTLEITAENDAIADTEFYLSAELVHDMSEDLYVYFPVPTPGAANTGSGRTGFTPKVAFSVPHGWKDAAFDLALSCPDNETAVIYYTLDGTSPSIGAPTTQRYSGPLHVDKTTVVRAAVPDVDAILQVDTSATYLFYDDVIAQGASVPDGFPANEAVNSQKMLYGLDTAVTQGDAETRARLRRGFTENTRTVSFVIDPKSLFDGASGIYVNASGNGRIWERQTMVEQINPMEPTDEFTIPAGLRIRGAFSRGAVHPKHSFRLFFRSEYGMGTLEHPVFGDEGASEFEKLDFRTSQNYAWANNENGDTFIHECFSRDSEGAMGKTYNRSRYYHLFINGVYWGLYQTEERVDDNYAASYNGGAAANYDVVRTSQPGYNTGIVEGETAAWTELWRITTQEGYGPGHEANFNKVLGLNPDGTRNPEYPILLNVTNLIEHILTVHFSEDSDAPVNSSGMANNIIGFRNRNDGEGKEDGFLWNRHDAEHSLGFGGGANQVKSIIWGTPEHPNPNRDLRALGNFNPNLLHYELMTNAVYRRVFADLVYKHMVKEGGALTAPVAEARYRARMAEIDDAIVCESARWGYQYETKRNRQNWLNSCNDRINFINNRLRYLIPEYQRRGWYPSIDAPAALDGAGSPVADGQTIGTEDMLYLTGSGSGTVYYTTDGSDPIGADGTPAAGAIEYSGASPVPIYVPVIAKGGVWKYFDGGSKPAENWTASDYVDTSWSSGAGRLGFGSGSFATALNRYVGGGSSGTQVVTYYFRRTFEMPAGAESMTSLKASLDCDDGYVAYVNGVEVGRDQVGVADYSAFATGTNMGEKDAVWTFPAGTLVEGENVIAVEVHQCNANSSDAWWDLALSYAKAGNVAGGIVVPPEGLTINARVLANGESGEWSALSTIVVKGEEILATQAEAIRIAAVYSSTADAKGDGAEFITLTNITEHAVLLDGLVIKAAKQGNTLATLCTLTDGRLEAGASITLTKAENWPAGKLTNGIVDMLIVDGEGETVQTISFSSKWFGGIADGTGDYLVAKEFGTTVTQATQWKPSESWVEKNLRFFEFDGVPADGNGGDTGEYFVLTNLSETVALDLTGVMVNICKSGDPEASAKCIVTIPAMTLAPGATVRFDQATYWSGSKQKITNGALVMKIYDAEGATVQVSTPDQNDAAFANYKAKSSATSGGPVLRATSFARETTTADWMEYTPPAPQVPTIEDGTEVGTVEGTVATIDAALAGAGTRIFIPAGVTEVRMSVKDGDNVVIDTTAYYAGSLIPQDGTVTPVLSVDVVAPQFVESAPEANDAIALTAAGVHLTTSVRPGLYYTLMRSGTVDGTYEPVAGSKVQAGAGETTLSFDVEMGGASSAFFKVEVTDR